MQILVDFMREQTVPGWVPRRLGGGVGGRKQSGQMRFGGRDCPFRAPFDIAIYRNRQSVRNAALSTSGKREEDSVSGDHSRGVVSNEKARCHDTLGSRDERRDGDRDVRRMSDYDDRKLGDHGDRRLNDRDDRKSSNRDDRKSSNRDDRKPGNHDDRKPDNHDASYRRDESRHHSDRHSHRSHERSRSGHRRDRSRSRDRRRSGITNKDERRDVKENHHRHERSRSHHTHHHCPVCERDKNAQTGDRTQDLRVISTTL